MTFVINQNETIQALIRRVEKLEKEQNQIETIELVPHLGPHWGQVETPLASKIGNFMFLFGRIGTTAESPPGDEILTFPVGFRPAVGAVLDQRGFAPVRNNEWFFTFNSGSGLVQTNSAYLVGTQIFLGAYGPFLLP